LRPSHAMELLPLIALAILFALLASFAVFIIRAQADRTDEAGDESSPAVEPDDPVGCPAASAVVGHQRSGASS